MSVNGFDFDGTIHRYNYNSLDNIPPNIAPAYSASSTYAVGDYCTKDNVLYKCSTAISTAEAWNSAHWTQVQLATDVANLKDDLEELEPISEDIKVALLDCFEHVAWVDEHGQDYYDALYNALYPEANLVSISVIFTQGSAVIYPSTPLNDLKAYLVVTGYYNDGTSKIITDYALSGILEVGTSTITVSKDEKTATFDVNVVALPSMIYEIESGTDISDTPIDTGVNVFGANDDYTILAKARVTSIPSTSSWRYLVNHGSVASGTLRLGLAYENNALSFVTNVMHGTNTVSAPARECEVMWIARVRNKHVLKALYVDGNRLDYNADDDITSFISSRDFTGTYKISTYADVTSHAGCFPGIVDKFEIYNVALQDSDIEQIMGIKL